MRLVIGGPTLAAVPAAFAVDLANLYAYTQQATRMAADLRFVQSTYVHVGREAVLDAALRIDATHVLWLDTDMRVPADTALRLAAHDLAVVGCNCVMKTPDVRFTAQRGGQVIRTGPRSTGLEAVDSVGMAVLLMRADVVVGLPRPWFRHGYEAGQDIGEDILFCRSLRAAGQDIWIDHDLSKEIGHIGQHTYRPRAVEAEALAV